MKNLLPLLLSLPLLFSCSGTPEFNRQNVQLDLTPTLAAKNITSAKAKRIFWGGAILRTRNLETTTHLEILAYPLDEEGWPNSDAEPLGRFIVERGGYMEPAKYAEGRRITVVGTILTTLQGKVGESDYLFPVVKPEQLHLWVKDYPQSKPQIHFGIGIGISR